MDTAMSGTAEDPKPEFAEPAALSGQSSKANEEDGKGSDAIRLHPTAEATKVTFTQQVPPSDEQTFSSVLPPFATANTFAATNPVEYSSTNAPDNDTVSVQGSSSEVGTDVIDVDQNVSL